MVTDQEGHPAQGHHRPLLTVSIDRSDTCVKHAKEERGAIGSVPLGRERIAGTTPVVSSLGTACNRRVRGDGATVIIPSQGWNHQE